MAELEPFDRYATAYNTTVQNAIGASGESVQFFAEIKAAIAAEICAASQSLPRSVLDFGCGIGNTTRALLIAFPMAKVSGCDPSEASLSVARVGIAGFGDRARMVAQNVGTLPFADGSFDLAFTSCVFHHVDRADHPRWARELLRVLEPGAPLLVFEHNPFNPLTRRVVSNISFDQGVILLRPRYARRMLEEAGFVVDPARYYFFFPHWLRRLRKVERGMRWLPLGGQYFVVARHPTRRKGMPNAASQPAMTADG